MTDRAPIASIVIPVYNGADFLREAVDSALAQTCRSVETIVINDGSRDDGATRAICLSYGDRIRYFEKENGGVANALNMALGVMRGEYFSWLSHDDIYRPDKLEKQLLAVRSDSDPARIVFSDYDLLAMPDGRLSSVRLDAIYPAERLTNSVFPILTTLLHGCTPLVHRSHFDRVGTFDERLRAMQDHDFWFRLLRGRKSLYLPESLVTVRLHPASGTNTLGCFRRELGETYLRSTQSLTHDEIRDMFPSPAAFYCKVAGLLFGYEEFEAMRRVMAGAGETNAEPDGEATRESLRQRLKIDAGDTAAGVHIFGLGQYGRRTFFELSARGLPIAGFSDNNPAMWGREFCHIPCISPSDLADDAKKGTVLIAMRDPGAVQEHLERLRLRCVAKQEIDWQLLQTPPLPFDFPQGCIA